MSNEPDKNDLHELIDTTVEIDPLHLRNVLGQFLTGVVVVTASKDGPVGMTVQSVASLSLDPPLVLFCPAKSSTSWPRIRAAGFFCLNILAEDQRAVAEAFARSGGDKFENATWREGHTKSPIIDGAIAHIEARLDTVHDGGDHEIAIGRVLALEVAHDAHPLLFFRGSFAHTAAAGGHS